MASNVMVREKCVFPKITRHSLSQCLNSNSKEEITKIESLNNYITYDDFFIRFMCANKPCKFSSRFTEAWKSRKMWTDDNEKPNFDYFQKEFGDALAPVANCDVKTYNSHCKEDMYVKDYIVYWREKSKNQKDMPCLYLKDWHFTRQFPYYEAYLTPEYFMSDWLNEFLDGTNNSDDYRFVYMGPKDSWTPFHADVFGSYSWSANICGRKKWILVPPGKENIFVDAGGKLLFDIKLDPLNKIDVIEVIQEPGEIIFVPSGWHHQVWNLDDTISINHNWFNGCNINYICKQLHSSLKEVQKEIIDCREMTDWDLQCQIILKTHHGMDLKDFCQLLEYIGNRATLAVLSRNKSDSDIIWHNVFDLLKVEESLQYILNENLLKFDLSFQNSFKSLYQTFKNALKSYNLSL